MERDFTKKGTMRVVSQQQRKNLQGYLPFYSVDTKEEADALIEEAIRVGEFYRRPDGAIIEVTLAQEQTVENLREAGERLHMIWLDMQERAKAE